MVRIVLLSSAVLVVIIGILGAVLWKGNDAVLKSNEFDLTFINRTEKVVVGLSVVMPGGPYGITPIQAGETKKVRLTAAAPFGEAEIKLVYKDSSDQTHEEILIGYIEQGYRGKAEIRVMEIGSDGTLDIEVTAERVALY